MRDYYVLVQSVHDDFPRGVHRFASADLRGRGLLRDLIGIEIPPHEVKQRAEAFGGNIIEHDAPPARAERHRVGVEDMADVQRFLEMLRVPVVAEAVKRVANGLAPENADTIVAK